MLEAIISTYVLIAGLLTWLEFFSFCFNDCNFIIPSNIDHIYGKVCSWTFCIVLGLLSPLFAIIKIIYFAAAR